MALSPGEMTAIGVGLANCGFLVKVLVDTKKNGKNGSGKTCDFHTRLESRMATVETHKEEMAKSLAGLHTENREDHKQIFGQIKELSVAVATAATAAATAATAAYVARIKE